MMLYKNTKAMIRLPDNNTDFFSIVAGVLQVATLPPYMYVYNLPRLCTKDINRSNKRKWFHIKES